ncbi:MAG: lysophospholipid acyltransferase family protein [Candidatus Eisenbacteria bacterium]|nr:lysophospholipid acyltransferase family protein [Candidatus Eisenbacteria bacterium]
MFAFAVYKLGAFLAQNLSLPTARKLAHVVGRLMCFFQRRNRRYLLRNLKVAFGDERSPQELKLLRRKIFENFAVFVTDFLRLPLFNRDNLDDYMTEGSREAIEKLGAYASPGTPAISTTAHVGNWEMGAAAVGLLAGPLVVLVDVHPSTLVTRFFDGRRADKGIDVVPVSAFHRCFRSLKRGHLVVIVGDRSTTGQGIRVPFFGREALVPDGYAVLARRFGARIIPTFMVMTPAGKHEFTLDDPIVPRVTDDVDADVRDTVERTVAVLERHIRRYPEQWYVFSPIWDTDAAVEKDRHQLRRMRRSTDENPRRHTLQESPERGR